MSEKLLTVSVAAYNVEKTLRKTLDSLIVPEALDKLEVFVIDDGGTDRSLEIAQEYEKRYPNTFHAIHKENGGYGSTVNYSLDHATGKYFRLLDGDDWFDADNLAKLIEQLANIDVDMIINSMAIYNEHSNKLIQREITGNKGNGLYNFVNIELVYSELWMHNITYKTALVQSTNLRLTEHCFYTDNEYVLLPVPHVETVYIWNYSLYQYRYGVAGQSMSISKKKEYYQDSERVFWRLVKEYQNLSLADVNRVAIFKNWLFGSVQAIIYQICLRDVSIENYNILKTFCERVRKELPEINQGAMRRSRLVLALYKSHYMLYPLCSKYHLWKEKRKRGGD